MIDRETLAAHRKEVEEDNDQWPERFAVWAVKHTHALIVQRLGFDPGTHLADLLLARHGDALAQLAFRVWLEKCVKEESAHGLNARSLATDLIPVVTADLYAELVEGRPLGDREAMAARAGVAKGTFVRFRARVFDPLNADWRDYQTFAAMTSRQLKVSRSRGEQTRWKGRGRDLFIAQYGSLTNKAGGQTPLRPRDDD